MILSVIVAYAKDKEGRQVIGRDNQIPWHFPHDLDRFKEHTVGHPIIMGRKTHESIGRILPGRKNVIVTTQDIEIPGAVIAHSMEEALGKCAGHNEVFIIGGQALYEWALPRADRLYVTSFVIDGVEGDTFFPKFEDNAFKVIHQERANISGDHFRILERKPSPQEATVTPQPANTNASVDADDVFAYNYAGMYADYVV
jgi:dihydrofolate reductase